MVTISEKSVGWLRSAACRNKMPHQYLAPPERVLRGQLQEGVEWLGLKHLGLTPYSFRRGGATYGVGSFGDLPKTLWRGQQSSPQTGRIYIQEGVAIQAQMRISAECHNRMDVATNAFKRWVAERTETPAAPPLQHHI